MGLRVWVFRKGVLRLGGWPVGLYAGFRGCLQGSRRVVYEGCWFRSRLLMNDETGRFECNFWLRALDPKR